MSNKINYNGKEYDGSSISINMDGIFIDGVKINPDDIHSSQTTYRTTTNHYYHKENKPTKKEQFKDALWTICKFILISAVISNLLWGFSTIDNPFRSADVVIANLLAYLFVMKKSK